MGFFTFALLLSFSSVLFCSYLLISLNTSIISVDLLFVEIQLTTGLALLYFLLAGVLITIILETLVILRKGKKSNE